MRRVTGVALIALVLSACGGGGGGGGGGGSSPPVGSSVTFSGTVAIGSPLAGQTVQLMHVDGATAFATTDAAGRYTVSLSGFPAGARPMFIIQTADPVLGPVNTAPVQYPRLYSVSNRAGGTLNVTPLTSLLVTQLVGERQGLFADLALFQSLPTPTDGQLATARQLVVNYLTQRPNRNDATLPPTTVDASAVPDFIHTPFNAVAGDPHDDAIESLAQTIMEGETIEGVEEHLLHRNNPVATLLEILNLEADVDCVAEGTANPALPIGRVHASLRPTGEIIVGNYTYTLVPNMDRVQKSNSPFFDDFWRFFLLTNGDRLEIRENASMLGSIKLLRSNSAVNCTPTTKIRLDAKSPSRLAQVRLLASAITSPTINCPTGSSYPGLSDGVNALGIQSNGALRAGGIGGLGLHLPSLGLTMSADIVSNAGVLGARVRTAAFSRVFAGGLDLFGVALDANGAIEAANFGQQRNNGASLNQSCG